jgi:hypothetical protein
VDHRVARALVNPGGQPSGGEQPPALQHGDALAAYLGV